MIWLFYKEKQGKKLDIYPENVTEIGFNDWLIMDVRDVRDEVQYSF